MLFLLILMGAVAYYLYYVRSISEHINNIILIQPASILLILLGIIVIPKCIHFEKAGKSEVEADETPSEKGLREETFDSAQSFGSVLLSVVLLGWLFIYILISPWIGLEVATFLFVLISLVLLGERKLAVLVPYSLVMAFLISAGVHWLLPYPVFMLFF